MKSLMFTFAFLASIAFANAQSVSGGDSMESQIAGQLAKRPADERRQLTLEPVKPNEIKRGTITYSGIAVQAVETDNPLHLVSPVAPATYGGPEQNVSRDPIDGKITGLKLLALNF